MDLSSLVFPLAQAAPAPAPDAFVRNVWEAVQPALAALAVLLVVGNILAILSNWFSSKLTASLRAEDTMGNAVKTWGVHLLVVIVAIVAAVIAVFAAGIGAGMLGNPGLGAVLQWILWALIAAVALVLIVQVPCGVYNIATPRSLAYLGISLLLWTVGTVGATMAFKKPLSGAVQQLQGMVAKLGGRGMVGALAEAALAPLEQTAGDRTKTPQERKLAIDEYYNLLAQQHRSLPPGDMEALAAYEKRRARYEQLLSQLRADVAAMKR